jgi:hypothetical protein
MGDSKISKAIEMARNMKRQRENGCRDVWSEKRLPLGKVI